MNDINQKVAIQFQNFLVKESHIIFRELGKYNISVNIEPSAVVLKKLNQYSLSLELNVKDEEDKFHINLQTTSLFVFNPKISLEKLKDSYFVNNAPAIVFPYLRAYIASLTALSGMPTLLLPTLNLSNLAETLKQNTTIVE